MLVLTGKRKKGQIGGEMETGDPMTIRVAISDKYIRQVANFHSRTWYEN